MTVTGFLFGTAAVITSIASLVAAVASLIVHRNTRTANGKTLGEMVEAAEPHHQRLDG